MAILKHQTRRGNWIWWLDEEILNTCEHNVSGLGDPVMSSQHVEKLDVGHPKIHSLKLKATTPERLGKRTCHLLAMNFQRFFALGFKEGTKHLLRYKGSNWETAHFRERTNTSCTVDGSSIRVSHKKDGFQHQEHHWMNHQTQLVHTPLQPKNKHLYCTLHLYHCKTWWWQREISKHWWIEPTDPHFPEISLISLE